MAIDFLVHEAGDGVGVAAVEGIKAGQDLTGWIMQEDQTITIKVLMIFLSGIKSRLKILPWGISVFKYGTDIGKVVVFHKKG